MFPSLSRRAIALLGTTAIALAGLTASPTAAQAQTPKTGLVYATTDGLAQRLAVTLHDPVRRDRVVSAVAGGPVELADLHLDAGFTAAARSADATVTAAKGLPAGTTLLQVRLADPGMLPALRDGRVPLVAATPTDDTATNLVGYDQAGQVVTIDAARIPDRPVLLVEVDTEKAVPLGINVLQQKLATRAARPAASAATGGYWATKVDAVRLSDDEEPWFKGAAEIYSIVGGTAPDGTAKVDIVQMPYLDYDGTTYYPNQLLVQFNDYKYNLADVVMMEDDGDTNYQQLAQAIAGALAVIPDVGAYVPLVNAILAAIPTSWYTDDPDYVDSWYTLSTTSSGHLVGASANGWMDVSPYFVQTL